MQSIEECRVQVAICLHILRSFGSAPRFYCYAASMTGIFDRTRLHSWIILSNYFNPFNPFNPFKPPL